MLKAAGIEPYQHLNVHGYWKVDEGKMSKSLGNVVKPLELVDIYGLDAFRYFLMREMVFGLDSDFSEDALVARLNADLANDLGNLVSRSLTMVVKFQEGEVEAPSSIEDKDQEIKSEAMRVIDDYCGSMKELGFHKALIRIWELIGKLNKYIVSEEPWVLAKSNRDRLKSVLYHLIQSIKIISVLLWPFMPDTCEKIQSLLNMEKRGKDFKIEDIREWEGEPGRLKISKPVQLFPRVDIEKLKKKEDTSTQKKEQREIISIEEFQKLDLRVALIKEAEPIKGSKKLVALKLDAGDERTVVAGIGKDYTPHDLVGKKVILVANLKPVKLMGVESRGMILASEDKSGIKLIVPEGDIAPGSKVK
jgi:methionyl-tRNA synthetase